MSVIIHISDLHFGDEDPALVTAFERYLSDNPPALVVASGDMTQRGKRREFAAAAGFLEGLAAPVLTAIGNHDTPMFNLGARLISPFRRFHGHFADMQSFRHDRFNAVSLNSARGVQARPDWSLGAVNLRDARRAADQLKGAPQDAAKIVVLHHPLVTPANAPFPARTRRGRKAAQLLVEHGVDLVLSGHLHLEFAEPLPFGDQQSWAIGANTAFSSRTRGAPPGFNRIIVQDDHFDVTFFHAAGGAFEPSDTHRLARRKPCV